MDSYTEFSIGLLLGVFGSIFGVFIAFVAGNKHSVYGAITGIILEVIALSIVMCVIKSRMG